MSTPAANDPPPEAVGPLERGLAVIRALTEATDWAPTPGAAVPTAQLVRATGLARSTVDRVVATLAACGMVRTTGRDVALAPGLAALGNAYLASCRLPALLDSHVRHLADRFDESVSVAVPDGFGVRFVSQLPRRRTMAPAFRIGDLLPAERCAAGTLFAADWDVATWQAWRDRLAVDPDDRAFPALHSPALHTPALHTPALHTPALHTTTPRSPEHHELDGRVVAVPSAAPTDHGHSPAQTFQRRVGQAARDGYAVDDQLVETGLVAVAVPVPVPVPAPAGARSTGSRVRARARSRIGISVVSHTSRHSAQSLAGHVLDALREVADDAAAALAADDNDDREPPSGTAEDTPPGVSPDTAVTAAVAAKAELGSGYLQSLARGLAVFTAFGAARRSPTLSEIATATGLPRATARRSLITLQHLGYVVSDGRRFTLLPRALELGFAPLTRLGVADVAQPHLRTLSDQVGESVSMAVLTADDDILYVARAPARRIMTVDVSVGSRLPAYPTSMGRVMLAGLPAAERDAYLARTRLAPLTRRTETDPARLRDVFAAAERDGYALVTEELEDGVQSIAVPVRDRAGRTVAAANVSMYAGRATPDTARESLLRPLTATAAAIGADVHLLSAFRPTKLL